LLEDKFCIHAGMDSRYLQRRNNYLSAYGPSSGMAQI
jgi:hypothetical protein